jgi:protein-tyrosine phosphatase
VAREPVRLWGDRPVGPDSVESERTESLLPLLICPVVQALDRVTPPRMIDDMYLYWIDQSLAIASRPRGEDWLDGEMGYLKQQGVDVVVSCLTQPEERELGLIDEEQSANRQGLRFVRSQMEDRGTPPNAATFEMIIDRLSEERRTGHRVAIHCRQGLGRSPLVAASVLVRSSMSTDDAWQLIAERRNQPVPDTEEQRQWLRSFAQRGKQPTAPATGRPD